MSHEEKYKMLHVIYIVLYNEYGWRWGSKLGFKEQ